MHRYLYVDFNSFFASCEQQSKPELRGKPVAVVPMLADSTCAIAASYEAKAFGIKTGTIIRDAKKMCPGLILVPAIHGEYVKYHHKAIELIDTVIPIDQVCSIDEVACRLTGSQQNEAKAIELAMEIKKVLAEKLGQCLTVSIGIGPNRLLAKMASDIQKPNGLTVLRESELVEKLSPLKASEIPGIGRNMEYRLQRHGIRTIGDLYKKNQGELRSIWGSILGLRLYYALRGWDLRSATESGKSIGHQHVLPPDKRSREGALITLEKLLLKAAVRLRKAEKKAAYISVSLRFRNREKWHQDLKFSPTQSTKELLEHLNTLCNQIRWQAQPIKTSVTLGRFTAASEGEQLGFFTDNRQQKLSQVVDEINSKFGRDTLSIASQLKEKNSAPTRIAFSRIPDLDEVDGDGI